MKRHEVLIPISREHHKILLLAQLLKQDAPPYKGMPADIPGKIEYLQKEWQRLVQQNIDRCRQIIIPFIKKSAEFPSELIQDIESQVEDLPPYYDETLYFQNEKKLDQLGHALEKYVRTLERQVFEEIQNTFDSQSFQALKQKISSL